MWDKIKQFFIRLWNKLFKKDKKTPKPIPPTEPPIEDVGTFFILTEDNRSITTENDKNLSSEH